MDAATIALARMRAQRLWGSALDGPEAAVRWLTAVQSQEHRFARWSVAQRTKRPDPAAVDCALDEGRILRTHVPRPTWHYVAREDLRWLMALSGPRVRAVSGPRLRELGLDAALLARSNDAIAEAVAAGPRTRREVAAALERKRLPTDGHRMTWMLIIAELDAVICSGPMDGKQHTYAAFDARVPPGVPFEGDAALAELARRYVAARGPATTRDFAWWSGLTSAECRRGIEMVRSEIEPVEIDGRTYWAAGRVAGRAVRPRVDLVQCYDEVIISYAESRDVLRTRRAAFPVPAAIDGYAHVVLLDGRLLGHWRQLGGRAVETRVPARLGRAEREALEAAVRRCRRFLEPTAV